MALDLVARISLRDDFSRRFRSISSSMGNMGRTVNNQAKQLTGLKTQLAGVVGAYVGAAGAVKAFNDTIGAAAQKEMAVVTVEAMFNDKALSDDYLKMVEKVAIDSPLLNSSEMLKSGKGFVAMSKDVGELTKMWGIAEKLQVLDPTQGTEGAAFALKEMFQGDSMSMVERFGLDKASMNRIKKLPIADQIREIDGLLGGMGINQNTIEKMGNTTLGQWSAINERIGKFKTDLGSMGNSKIGEVLGDVIKKFDSLDMDAIAAKIDAGIGGAVESVINFAKKAWEMRAPILATAKAVGAFIGIVAGIVIVARTISGIGVAFAFFASPIGMIALAIVGIGLAFKTAYKHSEGFRNAIDGLVGVFKGLFVIFGGNDAKGVDIMRRAGLYPDQVAKIQDFAAKVKGAFAKVMEVGKVVMSGGSGSDIMASLGFSPDMIAKITGFVTSIKTMVTSFVTTLKAKWVEIQPSIAMLIEHFMSLKDTAISIFTSLMSALQPVFSALGIAFGIIADIAVLVFNSIIAPAVRFVITMFKTLWIVVGPILELLGAAIGTAFEILKVVWDTILKPLATWLLSTFVTTFDAMQGQLATAAESFSWLGDKISGVVDWFKSVTDAVKNFKVPNWLSKLGGGGTVKFEETTSESKGKSNYHGIDYVPRDGFQATLHRGEKVITAQANRESKSGGSFGGVSITGNTFHVRQESDIDAIANALYSKLSEAAEGGA